MFPAKHRSFWYSFWSNCKHNLQFITAKCALPSSFPHFVVLMEMFPMGNVGCFPQTTPAATESRYPSIIHLKVHDGSFRVSIIHRALTWTTRSLTCVRDHSYACVYTPTTSQYMLTRKKTQFFLVLLTGFETSVFGSRVRRSTN